MTYTNAMSSIDTAAATVGMLRGREYLTPELDSLRGREYLRVSEDGSSEARSVTEQHEENKDAAEEHAITLGLPYIDNGLSASRYATKKRDDFEELVADLKADRFGADVLVLWENSRGSRKVSEWALLIELLEEKRVRVFVTVDGRLYDPAVMADRKVLQSAAIDSEQESLKTSLRSRRASKKQAAKGRPNGRPPHGYRAVYDPDTGKLVTWVENPDESMVPKELFERLREGGTFYAIAKDFAKRGYVNRSGRPFTAEHLRSMALRPAYGGYRVHSPKSRGRSFQARQVEATLTEATWDALVDRDTFWTVRRALLAPERRSTRNGRARHVLTMIIRCDVCSGPITHSAGIYKCVNKGCVTIDKADVDAHMIGTPEQPGVILSYLSSDRVYADLAATPQDDARVEEVRAELARLRANKQEMEEADAESLTEARILSKKVAKLEAKISALEAEERRLTTPSVLTDILGDGPGKDVAARWLAAPVAAQRKVTSLLLAPEVLGQVRIRPGRGAPAAERIVRRREGATAAP
jgi:site-specific DNA recombinase